MSSVRRSALVPYTAREMYALVDDIEAYPEFLPWCRSAVVHERSDELVKATLELHRSGLSKMFTTRNVMVAHETIVIELLDGPFNYLDGRWVFHELSSDASKVEFKVDFEFYNPILQLLLGPFFKETCSELVDSFRLRAETGYGRR